MHTEHEKQRLQLLHGLIKSKKYLERKYATYSKTGTNYHSYICIVAKQVTSAKKAEAVRKLMRNRLGTYDCMENFLNAHGISSDERTPNRMCLHRIAWLDLLIEEFSKPQE